MARLRLPNGRFATAEQVRESIGYNALKNSGILNANLPPYYPPDSWQAAWQGSQASAYENMSNAYHATGTAYQNLCDTYEATKKQTALAAGAAAAVTAALIPKLGVSGSSVGIGSAADLGKCYLTVRYYDHSNVDHENVGYPTMRYGVGNSVQYGVVQTAAHIQPPYAYPSEIKMLQNLLETGYYYE